ncbi:Uncharacterised protein [Mycobacterium tuberculosis]|uniref:Uncharacterized protein n=1 Tax=Mycobacterium tuberculosis TaxID=1773 RepID=A0A0T9BQ24_MYCTX|nr:hypothetical protein FF22_03493 [Mycobacterium tuberculosis]CFE81877.1 Uncharacterised protein [Mycobacterium tuberculosis]CFR64887.1 Uncharacterised protein [Mycobacterium tuberculosis]CKP88036.1 Uncharacterised protein [Mycobacterium tuberculosis]CKQ85820.1 Uncharacterised protein [Mycobacterium tuberculosis]
MKSRSTRTETIGLATARETTTDNNGTVAVIADR